MLFTNKLHPSTRSIVFSALANPYPTNPPPAQLVMPNFSLSPGGFGQGAVATNLKVWLAVIEEWRQCGVSDRFLGVNPLGYVPNTF